MARARGSGRAADVAVKMTAQATLSRRLGFGYQGQFEDGFAVGARRIHNALPGGAQFRFSGCLRNAVNGLRGIRPLAFEIGMAVHLMRQGWDVDFVDYSGSARFDFLIGRQGVEIEVELKSASGDAGRKIHRQEMNRLADLIVPTTTTIVEKQGCHLFRVTIPDRLPANDKELNKIAALVAKAADSKTRVSADECNIEYDAPNISDWPTYAAATKLTSSLESASELIRDTFSSMDWTVPPLLPCWSKVPKWLDGQNMEHVRGAPYHPMTQGKIERWHQTLKNRILLENYHHHGIAVPCCRDIASKRRVGIAGGTLSWRQYPAFGQAIQAYLQSGERSCGTFPHQPNGYGHPSCGRRSLTRPACLSWQARPQMVRARAERAAALVSKGRARPR
jgi:hypothetical protein